MVVAVLVVIAVVSGTRPSDIVSGQGFDVSPAGSDATDANIPTLRVTATDGGYWTYAEVKAGRYYVLLDNLTDRDVDLDFVKLPQGWTPERVQQSVRWDKSAYDGGGVGAGVIPTQEYVPLEFAGSTVSKGHSTGQSVVDLLPGEWLVTSLSSGPGSAYATVRVTP
jgi:hypothetical protein